MVVVATEGGAGGGGGVSVTAPLPPFIFQGKLIQYQHNFIQLLNNLLEYLKYVRGKKLLTSSGIY